MDSHRLNMWDHEDIQEAKNIIRTAKEYESNQQAAEDQSQKTACEYEGSEEGYLRSEDGSFRIQAGHMGNEDSISGAEAGCIWTEDESSGLKTRTKKARMNTGALGMKARGPNMKNQVLSMKMNMTKRGPEDLETMVELRLLCYGRLRWS